MSLVFDTVCHKTLLRKLDNYGLRGSVSKLLDFFLLRLLFVSLNNTHSTIRFNDYDLPARISIWIIVCKGPS